MACSTMAGVIARETASFVTATITTLIITTIEATLTTTIQILTTVEASLGEPLTISPPGPPWWLLPPASESTATGTSFGTTASPLVSQNSVITSTVTGPAVTITEMVIVLENISGVGYTSSTLTFPVATTTLTYHTTTTPMTVAVGQIQGNGWHTWSEGAQGGLIAGCLIAFFLLLFLPLCFCSERRKKISIASGPRFHTHPGLVVTYPPRESGHIYPIMRGGSGAIGQKCSSFIDRFKTTAEERGEGNKATLSDIKGKGRAIERAVFYKPPVSGG